MSGRKEELGEFVFKDGEALSAEIFSLSLHSKTPDLVYLDFSAGTLGEALHILVSLHNFLYLYHGSFSVTLHVKNFRFQGSHCKYTCSSHLKNSLPKFVTLLD
jgi:hypothetical protein